MEHPKDYSQLIILTLAGSSEAFNELYEATIKDVYQTVHFLVRQKSEVDDIVQEIYIQMRRSLEQFDVSRPFRPWLMGIAMRQIHAYRRKRWTQLRILKKAEQVNLGMKPEFTSEVVDGISNKSLLASVESLPYKLKQVIILHYLNELSQEESAAILGIPLGTVKSRIHAALRKLRHKPENQSLYKGKVEDLHEF
ncbi:RNA polymerase sigma factor [Paenibacillus sp. FSL R7-277]|uniref:sigma-70 family RNA polymerase sigma factor n=1 Tax=unclassified Paenibacillus TaxID=185978 RepID=UPI0003E1F980|nr:sigma-70 family RNA polymerase sigma factor [Paenibacillus sp. FSL R7-277]ETT77218.1 RNA polymerase sigma factor [Paenibacillus sp. FSL R7-277]